MTNLNSVLKNRDIKKKKKAETSLCWQKWYSQTYGFSSSHVCMWELNQKGWVWKNLCFQIMVLEKTLESPLDCKIKPVSPKGNQSRLFIGRTDAEAEASILWPPDAKSWITGKDSDAWKDWRQKEKRVAEDEMVRQHHWLNGHEFEWRKEEPGMLWTTELQRIRLNFSSLQFSCSVVSDSLRPYESQHARPPRPSPTPGVYSNSCP